MLGFVNFINLGGNCTCLVYFTYEYYTHEGAISDSKINSQFAVFTIERRTKKSRWMQADHWWLQHTQDLYFLEAIDGASIGSMNLSSWNLTQMRALAPGARFVDAKVVIRSTQSWSSEKIQETPILSNLQFSKKKMLPIFLWKRMNVLPRSNSDLIAFQFK